jgi:hypothetical protein
VVTYPASAPAIAEHKILSVNVCFDLSLTIQDFNFSKEAKNMALKGPKNNRVAPKALIKIKLLYKVL